MAAHYDIFRHHLWTAAPAYGHALWDPNPGNLYPAVEVGDVGYIREGKFRRLFNVLLPAEDPSHLNFGIPEYHEQLTLDIKNHIDVGNHSPHKFYSVGVALVRPENDRWADRPKKEGEVCFSCPMNQGAALCLPVNAKREDTVAKTKFGKWMIKHIDCWFAWARQLELGVDRMEDIILVTGTHRTRSCGNVAFPGGQQDAQVSFRAKVDHPGEIVAITWQFSHDRNRGAFLNCGPDGEDLPENQCIFIRGFRVTRKYKIFPRLKAAAGPNPDSDGYDKEPDSDVELIQVPAVPEYRDPLHILLQFIAEEAPNCDMVLVHDNDLAELHGIYDGTPIESLQPDVMLSHFRSAQPKIHEVLFGPDLSSADNGRSADTETVRIATLSNFFEKLTPPSTFSLSQSFSPPSLLVSRSHSVSKRLVKLIVFVDFVSPWCFITHRDLQTAITHSANLPVAFDIDYRPFLLVYSNIPVVPVDRNESLVNKFGRESLETLKPRLMERGEAVGIKFSFAGPICMTLNAHRLASKAYEIGGSAAQSAFITLIFRAYCEDDLDINDAQVLADAAERSGVMSKVEALSFLNSDECLEKVNYQVAEARAKGVTGVPFTIIDGKWAVSGAQPAHVFINIFNKLAETTTAPPSQSTTPVSATTVAVA